MNFHCNSRNRKKGNCQSSGCSSSSSKKGRGNQTKASTPHLYFTQSMQREEQDIDELEWEAERYTSLARRRGLRANLYGKRRGTSNNSSSNSKSIKSSRKKRSIARALSLYKEGQQVLVFYRGENSGKWYDATISIQGRNSMKVLYAIDQSEERIYADSDGSFNSRIKSKTSSTKSVESKRYAAAQSTFEDQDDEASVEFNEDEEIVSTPATGSKTKSHKRRRLRLETRRMMMMRLWILARTISRHTALANL